MKEKKTEHSPGLPPRFMLAAPASGTGKTLLTCGLLQLLTERGKRVASFKCGPDYIDPMFHATVLGTASGNLDTFFLPPEQLRALMARQAADSEIAVLEGVMGYYDGLGGVSTRASAYEVACATDTPVILIVNARGMSISAAALVGGFASFREDSHIRGVILNQASPSFYPRLKEAIEAETGLEVLGYVPKVTDCQIESRHLGLVLPEEVPALREKLHRLAEVMAETLEVDRILELAQTQEDGFSEKTSGTQTKEAYTVKSPETEDGPECRPGDQKNTRRLRIGIARDEAFCFFYAANLTLLQDLGAELIPFSPLREEHLPENLDGLLLYGGYPELHGRELSENTSMREEIGRALAEGLPCMAECGGFMYLHEYLEDAEGRLWPMVGRLPGKVWHTGRLSRFGYVELTPEKEVFGQRVPHTFPAHEFHYYDSENCGTDFRAEKPLTGKGWTCMHAEPALLAGFPHLFYPACPDVARGFLRAAADWQERRLITVSTVSGREATKLRVRHPAGQSQM